MQKVQEMLEANIPLRSGTWNTEEVSKINEVIPQCITLKPIVYLVNLDAASYKRRGNKWLVPIADWVKAHGGGQVVPMSVEWEQQLWELREKPVEKEAFLALVPGLKSMLPRIVKIGLVSSLLDLFVCLFV